MIPENITEEHIKKAIQEIRKTVKQQPGEVKKVFGKEDIPQLMT